ncbi:MAG TPA: TadE family protein [Chloroflexota bacterium]|nr:TadE family protein [Chloroflexota bacterium]
MLSRRGGGQVNAGVAEAVRECGDGGYLVWRCKLPARWRRANRKGQALVELAFVTVVLAIILLGIIELFSIYSSRNNLSDASRAGDRLASLNYGDTAINNTIMRMLGAAGLNTVHGSTCDITRIEIYDANPDGSVMQTTTNTATNPTWLPYPNFPAGTLVEDIYTLQPYGSSCSLVEISIPSGFTDENYVGTNHWFPANERINPSQKGNANPSIGVRVSYNYTFHTPVLSASGASFNLNYSTVQALGGDNANNYLGLATSTSFPTWTLTPTSTRTPTNTSTPTATKTGTPTNTGTATATGTVTNTGTRTPTGTNTTTPTATPTPTNTVNPLFTATKTPINSSTPTATNTPTNTGTATSTGTATNTGTVTNTGTPTTTGTVTSTPTITNTPSPTPIPTIGGVSYTLPLCDAFGHWEGAPPFKVSWNVEIGATGYQIYYQPTSGSPILLGTVSAPTTTYGGVGVNPPAISGTGGYFYVVPVFNGTAVTSAQGDSSTILSSVNCQPNS